MNISHEVINHACYWLIDDCFDRVLRRIGNISAMLQRHVIESGDKLRTMN